MTKFKRICCIKRTWNNTVMHFLLYLHLLVAKIIGSIFYCILDFLLDFQETAWVAFFISGSQWMNNHINKTLKTSCSRFYPLNRLLGRGHSVERWTAKFLDKKKRREGFQIRFYSKKFASSNSINLRGHIPSPQRKGISTNTSVFTFGSRYCKELKIWMKKIKTTPFTWTLWNLKR